MEIKEGIFKVKVKIYIWYPILVSVGLGFTFMNIPPVGGQFMAMMNVGYDGLSWLLSGLFWSHAFGQIPAGFIADRCSFWKTAAVGLTICLFANLLPFLAPANLTLATGLRFLLGVGTSLSFMAAMKIMLVLAPSEKITTIQGFQGASFSIGFLLPYLTLPYMGPMGPKAWPYAYIISAALVSAALVATLLLPREKLSPPQETRSSVEVKTAIMDILTARPIWFLGIFHGLSYGSLNNLGNWLPSILSDLGGGQAAAWAWAAAAILFLGALGRALAGPILGALNRGLVVNGAVLIIGLMYLVMGLAGSKFMLLGAATLMALACGSTYGGIFTLSAAAGGVYAATAMGLMNMIGNLFNVGLTLVFGYVRQYTGQFGPSLLAAGIIGLLAWLAGRALIIRLDQRRPR